MNRFYTLAVAASLFGVGFATAQTNSFEFNIDSEEEFARWTSIDANGDGDTHQFTFDSTLPGATYKENKSSAADDWLISPAIEFEGGKSYEITFYLRKNSNFSSDKEKFKIFAGAEPTVAAMTTQIGSAVENFTSTYYKEQTYTFSPAESGPQYIGFYLYTGFYNGGVDIQWMKVSEKVAYAGKVTGLTATPGEKGALSATLTWTWPSVNGLGGKQQALTGAKIYRGTSSYFSVSDTYLVGTTETGGEAGTQGEYIDESIPSAGSYYYKVVPIDANGESQETPSASGEVYVGTATSIDGLKNVTAAIADGTEKTVELTWDAPTASKGYLDPTTVVYRITRKKGSDSAVTLVEDWSGELPYVDNTIDGAGKYTYTVYAKLPDRSYGFSGSSSNQVVISVAQDLPYSEDFSSSSSIDFYTFFHGPDCTRDWGRSSNSKLSFWGGGTADAWACTPKFNMETCKAYKVSFDANVSNASSPKDLYVYVGAKADAETLEAAGNIFFEKIESGIATTKEAMFSVPESGEYVVAFRCYGETNSNDLFVDNVKIEEVDIVPLAVTELKAEAASEGALKATVSWVNPSADNAGGQLASLTKAEVKLGAEVVATVENPVPGEASSVEVPVEAAGKYEFSVSVFSGENESIAVKAESDWVGQDTPAAPATVTVAVNDDETRTVTFDSVDKGINDGWLGEVVYNVYRNDDLLAEGISETSFDDTEAGLPLAKYVYSVTAIAGDPAVESGKTSAEAVILGEMLELPYETDFSTSDDADLWTFGNEDGSAHKWKYNSSDSDIRNEFGNAGAWAFTPPLLAFPGDLTLSATMACYNSRYTEEVSIYLVRNADAQDPQIVATIAEDVAVDEAYYPSAQTFAFSFVDDPVAVAAAVQAREPIRDEWKKYKYHVGIKLTTDDSWTLKIKKLALRQDVATGIDAVAGAEGFGITDGMMLLPEGARVDVYTVAGSLVASYTETFATDGLQKGAYIAVCTMADGTRTSVKFVK